MKHGQISINNAHQSDDAHSQSVRAHFASEKRTLIKALAGFALVANAGMSMAQTDAAEIEYEQGMAAASAYRYALALENFERAAEQGHREAQNIAGLMFYYGNRLFGNEIRADHARARHWLERASSQGSEVSSSMLRKMEVAGRLANLNEGGAK